MTALATAYALRDFGYVPHAPALIEGSIVELISYAFPFLDREGFGIMARRTPGDPTSVVQLEVPPEAVDLARVW